jgi:hypothetical protein
MGLTSCLVVTIMGMLALPGWEREWAWGAKLTSRRQCTNMFREGKYFVYTKYFSSR